MEALPLKIHAAGACFANAHRAGSTRLRWTFQTFKQRCQLRATIRTSATPMILNYEYEYELHVCFFAARK